MDMFKLFVIIGKYRISLEPIYCYPLKFNLINLIKYLR